MAIVETKIGDVNVLMETYDYDMYGLSETDNTDSVKKVSGLFEDVSNLVNSIAVDFSQKLKECSPNGPDEVKIGFGVGVTAEKNILVVKGSGELTINVELTWKKEKENK